MSQRGGEVQAHLRISSDPISSDLIPKGKADMIISMEPMEALRYLPFLTREGWIVSNDVFYKNIDNYPVESKVIDTLVQFQNHRLINAEEVARKAGSAKASNMVLLGASSDLIGLKKESLGNAIGYLFEKKGERILETNFQAFDKGQSIFEEDLAHA